MLYNLYHSIIQQLNTANETIASLQEDLALRERLYQDLRLAKDRELNELRKINSDLEVRIIIRTIKFNIAI